MKDKLIISDPAVKLGRPVLAGTRLTVDQVVDEVAEGRSVPELLEAHPGLTPEAVRAALRFAAEAVRADSPIEKVPALELHGAHPVQLPNGSEGGREPAVAVRAYLPEAAQVAVRRAPVPPAAAKAWLPALEEPAAAAEEPPPSPPQPMEQVHPAGVFEAVFPGETQPFGYQLEVTSADGETRTVESPYGLPAVLGAADIPPLAGPPAGESPSAPPPSRLYRVFGAHALSHAGVEGIAFALWAPHASAVSLVGSFNDWNDRAHPMRPVGSSGVWELFVPGLAGGELYKYRIFSGPEGRWCDKADPFAFATEMRPGTASVVLPPVAYAWGDSRWMAERAGRQALDRPISIYEVHLGSWLRSGERWLSYRELADELIPYVKDLGFTHLEPMPVCEHPFDGSWGYQVTGYFAPTSRYGSPDDFRYFVDRAHQAGLGVILDWVPGHFPKDAHGLALFDGTPLYEHADPRRSENLEWGTLSFNLGREEVAAFLLSSAVFWIEEYHADGLRLDAVSSMIYLDYSRQHWVPNEQGGRENLEAAAFLRRLNALVHREHPGVLMVAEESTAWPHVTDRGDPSSLGFDLKWNLGWMHDTLGYLGRDPVHRRFHHNDLTFSLLYAFKEQFLLAFSHDEVVHGKRSLLGKMPGDEWQQFANLRLLYGYMYAHPGKKLLFMGSEFGPRREWSEAGELDWGLLRRRPHQRLRRFMRALNELYAREPALHQADFGWEGFQWIDCEDAERSVIAFLRRPKADGRPVVAVANFTPVPRPDYCVGVPLPGAYAEILNSDAAAFGGSGVQNPGLLQAVGEPRHGQPCTLSLSLPPLAVVLLAPEVGTGIG